jgi:hypothetical protein
VVAPRQRPNSCQPTVACADVSGIADSLLENLPPLQRITNELIMALNLHRFTTDDPQEHWIKASLLSHKTGLLVLEVLDVQLKLEYPNYSKKTVENAISQATEYPSSNCQGWRNSNGFANLESIN